MSVDTSADPFTAHRNLLFTVAYELLGSAADAEDVVQDAWLKWDAVDQDEVHNPRAYLVRIVTRTALDHLRTVTRRREDYVGPWLPEPLVTSHDVAEDVELAESVSMAMLLVLETLTPTERAVFVLREVAAQFERPVLLFSGGKDSIVLSHLARRAFWPGKIPFPLMHIDTGHNFEETLDFRDRLVEQLDAHLIVRYVQDSIDQGRVVEETGPNASRNTLQTVTLLDAIAEFKFEAAIGGARRDEEKARAKERFFSHRDTFGQWDPKNQRPELWNLFNGRKHQREHFRVFPLSNWTEMDIWQYIALREVEIPVLYYSHRRDVIRRDGVLLAASPYVGLMDGEQPENKVVRFRTIGDMTCTGAVESHAASLDDIIREVAAARETERGTRADDKRSEAAMEDRKRVGYF